MTSRGNLNTLRQLFSWNSTWYSKSSYKQLIFRDLVIEVYLTSLFYKLRIPTSYFLIKSLFFDFYIIETDLYVLKKKKLAYIFLNYTKASTWFFKIFTLHTIYQKDKQRDNSALFYVRSYIYAQLFAYCTRILLSEVCNKTVLLQSVIPSTTNTMLLYVSSASRSNFLLRIMGMSLWKAKKTSTKMLRNVNLVVLFLHYYTSLTTSYNELSYSSNAYFFIDVWTRILKSSNIFNLKYIAVDGRLAFHRRLKLVFFKTNFYSNLVYRFWILKRFFTFLVSLKNSPVKSKHSIMKFFRMDTLITEIDNFSKMLLNSTFVHKTHLSHSIKSRNLLMVSFKWTLRKSSEKHALLFFYDYYFKLFKAVASRIECSLRLYTTNVYFFYPTIFLSYKPFIKNSKLICEYITMSLEGGMSINNVWKNIKIWILDHQSFLEDIDSAPLKRRILSLSRNPLKGIRIICRGPNYKARRKRKFVFHSWVSDNLVTGKMPTQSFDAQLDFFQSFAIMKQATIGVRVWTLFEFIKKT